MVVRMRSASRREKPIGFSTSTGLPSSSALSTGWVCCCSGVETITAVTSGWLITSSLSLEKRSAPAASASARARAGSRSEIARNRTEGCLAASRARSVPMRPAPTTATPILDCFIHPLLTGPTLFEFAYLVLQVGPDAGVDVAEFRRDRELCGRQAGTRQRNRHHGFHPSRAVGRDDDHVGQEDRLVQVVGHEQH